MLLATYTRFSSDMQRHESITAQLRAINEWAKKNRTHNSERLYR